MRLGKASLTVAITCTDVLASVAVLSLSNAAAGQQPAVAFPPYPNVWFREVSIPVKSDGIMQARKLASGDILLYYAYRGESSEMHPRGITFFTHKTLEKLPPNGMDGGERDFYATFDQSALPGGTVVESEGSGNKHCNEFFYYNLEFRPPQERSAQPFQRRALIYLRDKPKRAKTNQYCDYAEESFDKWIEPLSPWLIPLDDGSSLLVSQPPIDRKTYVLRIRADLSTDYPDINRRLFWIDPELVDQIVETSESMQQASYRLAQYLKSLRRGKIK